MNILHLLASPYWSGPMENVALLALEQRRLGHRVSVAVDRKRLHAPTEELAVPRLEALGLLDDGGLELSVKSWPWRWVEDVSRLRRRGELNAVHAHFSHDHLVAAWGAPRGATVVRSIHAARSLSHRLPRADAFTVPPGLSLDPRRVEGARVEVWPPMVAAEFVPAENRSALRRRLGLEGAPLIGMVSTFQPSRRHGWGVEAFALLRGRLPEARLVLIGDGAELPRVREQVAAAGLEPWVTFTGYQRGQEFVAWLQALDEVWILGLGNDYSGRAAAQARACGVRVVAVDEGGLSGLADETVTPGAAVGELVRASLSGRRRDIASPGNGPIAETLLALYESTSPPVQRWGPRRGGRQ